MPRFRQISLALAAILVAGPVRAADLDQYLPDDADFVMSASIRDMLTSPIVKKYVLPALEMGLECDEAKAFTKLTGMRVLKDVDSVAFSGKGSPKDKKWLLIVRGTFDEAKIQDSAQQLAKDKPKELKIHDEGKAKIFEFLMPANADHGEQSAFGTVLSKNLIVLSPIKDQVKDAIAKREANRQAKVNNDLKGLVAAIDGKQAFWMAGVVTDDMRAEMVKTGFISKQKAEKIRSISGGAVFGDAVKGRFLMQTPDEKTAKDFRVTLDGMRALVIMALDNLENLKTITPFLKDFVDLFRFSNDKNAVVLDVNVSEKFFEKMNQIDPKDIPKKANR